jgi:hypothetical protein
MPTVTMSDCGTKITVIRETKTKSTFTYRYTDSSPATIIRWSETEFGFLDSRKINTKFVLQGMEDELTERLQTAGISYVN